MWGVSLWHIHTLAKVMVQLVTQVGWNIKSYSEISQHWIVLKHFLFRNGSVCFILLIQHELNALGFWSSCTLFLEWEDPCFTRKIFPGCDWRQRDLVAKAVYLVGGLHLSSSCVVFARYVTPLSTLVLLKWDYCLGERSIWGATELVAVRILWEVLVLYIIPRLCAEGPVLRRRHWTLFFHTQLGKLSSLEKLVSKALYHYIQSMKTL